MFHFASFLCFLLLLSACSFRPVAAAGCDAVLASLSVTAAGGGDGRRRALRGGCRRRAARACVTWRCAARGGFAWRCTARGGFARRGGTCRCGCAPTCMSRFSSVCFVFVCSIFLFFAAGCAAVLDLLLVVPGCPSAPSSSSRLLLLRPRSRPEAACSRHVVPGHFDQGIVLGGPALRVIVFVRLLAPNRGMIGLDACVPHPLVVDGSPVSC
mmetsp:Transcript_28575/g.87479  ORF Transcript_28575/g.87479 Transcript_28575/m.87479 type:complete len:212 (+) Transcript_28575:160-795(+)